MEQVRCRRQGIVSKQALHPDNEIQRHRVTLKFGFPLYVHPLNNLFPTPKSLFNCIQLILKMVVLFFIIFPDETRYLMSHDFFTP